MHGPTRNCTDSRQMQGWQQFGAVRSGRWQYSLILCLIVFLVGNGLLLVLITVHEVSPAGWGLSNRRKLVFRLIGFPSYRAFPVPLSFWKKLALRCGSFCRFLGFGQCIRCTFVGLLIQPSGCVDFFRCCRLLEMILVAYQWRS